MARMLDTRRVVAALIGAACGLLLVRLGFNVHLGATQLGPPYAYPVAALAGAFAAVVFGEILRTWWA